VATSAKGTRVLVALLLLFVPLTLVTVERAFSQEGAWHGPILPAPAPFSLNSYDAIQAVMLIRRAHFLQYWDGTHKPESVTVHDVHSFHIGFNPEAYPGHRHRYDLMLNEAPLDWDHLYIEYKEDMVNLRLLFTYRNQQPVPEVPYRLRYPSPP